MYTNRQWSETATMTQAVVGTREERLGSLARGIAAVGRIASRCIGWLTSTSRIPQGITEQELRRRYTQAWLEGWNQVCDREPPAGEVFEPEAAGGAKFDPSAAGPIAAR